MKNNKKIKGKVIFKKYKKIIILLSRITKILPTFILQFFWDLIKPFNQNLFILFRYLILKSRIDYCGDNVRIGANVTIKGWKTLRVGENVSIHDNCYIDAGGNISIGANVSIAHNSTLLSGTHTYDDKSLPIKYNVIIKNGLKIHDDVWIGCGVRILSNISIGCRSIVAAGAVVNKTLEGNAIYGGLPAKKN